MDQNTLEEMTTQKLNPPLKWAGGKRWLVKHLQPFWVPFHDRRLVEPFCGGLAVSLGLMPGRALLNDVNPHLINFYRWVKKGLVISELELAYDSDLYYAHRERFNRLIREGSENSKESAQLFYYLNRTGYNGLCRFNKSGEFNVPFGKYKTIRYTDDFTAYQSLLDRWEFSCADFMDLIVEPDDFIYADPPYDVEFRQYSKGGFTWEDQVRLVAWLSEHPGPVVLSNQATPRIVALCERNGFELRFLDGPRRINSSGDRTPAKEVLAVKGV